MHGDFDREFYDPVKRGKLDKVAVFLRRLKENPEGENFIVTGALGLGLGVATLLFAGDAISSAVKGASADAIRGAWLVSVTTPSSGAFLNTAARFYRKLQI